MGYELKRVALDFKWPLKKVWKGFKNPHPGPPNCPECDGEGVNAATRDIGQTFYDHDANWRYDYTRRPDGSLIPDYWKGNTRPPFLVVGATRRWCDSITQDEVDALVREGRLHDFTHRWDKELKRWVRHSPNPSAAVVNEWNSRGGFGGHDAINRWILVETRARRLGVYGKCPVCKGRGEQRLPRKAKKRHKNWKEIEPPAGPGWQVWETVTEGSPVTPVCPTADALVDWMGDHGWDRASAAAFCQVGWVMTAVMTGGELYVGIDAAPGMVKL